MAKYLSANQPETMALEHATCVVWGQRGVLIRGVSGSGKSSLALRLIDRGAMLVGDDYVQLYADNGALIASPAPRLAGLMEVRGVGLLLMPYRRQASVALVVTLEGVEERLPEPKHITLSGVSLSHIHLNGLTSDSALKVEIALSCRSILV